MKISSQVTSPFVTLKRAHLATRGLIDRGFATLGVSLAQYQALRLLDEEPGISGAELARRSSVTAPTMNEIVGGLERNGLIVREPAPEGRRLLAHLTPAGEEVIARCVPMVEQMRAVVFASIDAARLADAMAVLEEISDAADAFDEGALS